MHFLDQNRPGCAVGDLVSVHEQIREGSRRRVRPLVGVVIASGASLTLRRLVRGEGVERTFPSGCPSLVGVEVHRRARVRRAKLTYLRQQGLQLPELREAQKERGHRRRKRGAKAKAERLARRAARAGSEQGRQPPPFGAAGALARLRPGDPPFAPPRPGAAWRAFDRE